MSFESRIIRFIEPLANFSGLSASRVEKVVTFTCVTPTYCESSRKQ